MSSIIPFQWSQEADVTDSAGNETHHIFSALSDGCNVYETLTESYNGNYYTGTLLKTVKTDYTSAGANPNMLADTVIGTQSWGDNINVLAIRTTTTLQNGMQNKVETDYDSGFSAGFQVTPVQASYGTKSQVREYEYGNGAPGTLLRCTQYAYKAFQTPSYLTANLLDLTTTKTVYSGACGSGTQISQTTYGYDETTLASSGVTTGHDTTLPNPGVRGNQTSIHDWLNTTGGTLITTKVFYDTGLPHTMTDPRNNTTTYAYSPTYIGAYQTQTNMPDTGSPVVHHVISGLYDFNSGLLTSFTDQNSQNSTYTYDALERATLAKKAVGSTVENWTTYSYPNFKQVNFAHDQAVKGDGLITASSLFDGLGRIVHKYGPDGFEVDTTYDAEGRVASVSNPHGTTSSPSDGVTTYQYDALDRKIAQTQQDGTSVQHWCYDGVASASGEVNCTADLSSVMNASWVDSTDEVGLHSQQVSDGLGRLMSAMESDGSTTVPKTPSMETDYTYDLLNNLLRVDQWGGPHGTSGERLRTFTYDSLSRLITAANPETGTICYGTWSGGTVGSGTCQNGYDANSNLLVKTDARGITKTYATYDALNRPTSYSYSDGTPGVSYVYDAASEWSTTLANPIGRLSLEKTSDSHSQSIFGYDAMGRPVTRVVCTPATCGASTYDMGASYDLAGELTSYKNGNGLTISLTYDVGERLTNVASSWVDSYHPSPLWTTTGAAGYGPVGLLQGKLGNGILDTRVYDNRARITSDTVSGGTSYSYSLTYNANSSIHTANDSANGNWTYTYDNLDRLSTAAAGVGGPHFGGTSLLWGYDAFGNRKSQTATAGSAPQPVYTPTATNQVTGYCYDAAGDLLDPGTCPALGVTHQYTYDGEGRITSPDYGSTTYQYDPEGRRISKKNTGNNGITYDLQSSVEYLYDPTGNMVAEMAPLAATKFNRGYVNAGGKNLALYGNGVTSFPVTDWLGTMRQQFAQSGSSYLTNTNLPFGDMQPCAPPTVDPCFTGKQRDQESGLDDFIARYYTSNLGRFMSPDWSAKEEPVPYSKLDNPQSLNLYSYVNNNPLNSVDADGHNVATDADASACAAANSSGNSCTSSQPNLGAEQDSTVMAAQQQAAAQQQPAQQQTSSSSATVSPDEQARRDNQEDMVVDRTTQLLGDSGKDLDIRGSLGGCHLVGGNCEFKINNPDLTDAVNSAMGNTDPKTSGGRHAGAQYHDKNLTDSLHHDNDSLHVDHFNSAKLFPLGVSLHFIVDVTIGHLPYYGSNHAFSY